MSDTIPPLYSSSPPPLTKSNFADDGDSEEDEDDDDDEEYGKFEEYSAVYDHTVEEILSNSPRKPIKSDSKTTISSSESITGKNITDSPNNLHCTTDLNLSSVPLSSDFLHSKSSDRSITNKVLENNSINIENTFSDSAINILGTDDVSVVLRDNVSRDNSTSKVNSEPVTIGNSINCTESISEKIVGKDKNSCDSSDCNDMNIYAGSELNKAMEKIVYSKVNSIGVSSIPIVNNCSNLTSTVGESLNDDFEFDDFQSFSDQTASTLNFVTDIHVVEKSDITQEFNAFTTEESFSHKNDMPNLEAVFAQSDVNHRDASNDTLSCVTKNLDETDGLSMFKKLETNLVLETNGSLPIVKANSAVRKNSNDLSNGFNVFNNTINSGSVTTVESNFSPVSSVINAAALESNQITEDIMKAGKKGAECSESNSKGTSLNLVDKIILVSQSLKSNEDDGFGDFEFTNAPQRSTIESLNHVCDAQSQVELLSDDDDFCDFESANTLMAEEAVNEESVAINEIECPAFETDFTSFASHSLVDDSDDFSDFKSTNVDLKISPNDSKTAENSIDLGGNFGDFKTSLSETRAEIAIASSKFDDAEGEFDDFSDFSTYEQSSVPKLDGAESAGHEGDKFWINLFPLCEEGVREIDVVSISDLVVASRIWTKLCDVESSQALAFEWSKSTSYNKYLSSLKIDVRNVFGVQWRSNVPRFAANLGCVPLEPLKAVKDLNPAKPVSGQSSESLQSNHPDLVPAAHFDWISSGLVNPLDGSYSTLLDINLLDTFVSCESTKKKGIPAAEPPPKQKSKDEAIDAGVQEFLQSLPDLSFMLVSHIQFPMNPTNTDKSS